MNFDSDNENVILELSWLLWADLYLSKLNVASMMKGFMLEAFKTLRKPKSKARKISQC